MKRAVFLCLTLLGSALQAAAQPRTTALSPVQLVDRFYAAYLRLAVSGLPNKKQSETLKPFLDQGLNKRLAVARQKQADEIKRHPDDKPPWGDGDLFSSLFEGAQRYKVEPTKLAGNRAIVPVRLEYGVGKSFTRWMDTFVLTQEKENWKISDIKMGGQWQFKQGSSLRGILAAP